MRSRPLHLFLLGLLLGGSLACSESPPPAEGRPSVILLFADDLGYGDLQCYGNPNIRTPRLDRMASEGLRMTSFYAGASVCTPSRASLLTGRYPLRAGLPGNLGPASEGGLPLSEVTIAELVKQQDYSTMAIGKWHLGHSEPEFMPTSRGFDHYFGLLYSNDMRPPWVQTDLPLRLYRDREPLPGEVDQDQLTLRYTEEALSFIRENRESPFFLYLAYSMPHLPIHTASGFRGESLAGLYGDVIETIDWSVGSILDLLQELEIEDSTLILFTSDNGPWLDLPDRMLQEGNEPWHAGSPGPLNGAKGTSWEGGFRVPGIARWSGVIPPGRVSSEMVSAIDLFPTIAAAVGEELPEDRIYDGFNLLSFFRGESATPRDHFFFFRGRRLEAVRVDELKFRLSTFDVNRAGPQPGPLSPQLFDLAVDFGEQYNIAGRRPDMAQQLRTRLEAFADELGAEIEGEGSAGD